ncbi:hypothetical protein SmJEL517_g02959 [Synchytrium microbalum]|uniref:sphinganine-1-phosphate aldolase n=1 Tax=Synchytrium microbalum TaxID=1806994 RepID=A0A507C8U8_9FUNG|nr:uncharacterized protein SmJEL517_g02959 [Synchytrium microbalum]TPX34394.1 hypothetical protein SmJEL517_g02959 [Synchytrium microbalum]
MSKKQPSAYGALPKAGLTEAQVRQELQRYSNMGKVAWQDGRVTGAVYHGGPELNKLLMDAAGMFAVSNPLHPDVFPGVRQMEAECLSMVLRMYNAPADAGASFTSGGTESILMACMTYRNMAKTLRGITDPNMVVPRTIHAAFDKAAAYFNITIIHVDVDPTTGQVDLQKMEEAINPQTVFLGCSSPNYPHGIVDNVPKVAALAKKHNLPCHVDCCLGGFIVPFAEKAGYPLPYFVDFRNEGVTSISADQHKYGFAIKGASTIMYRNKEIRKHQYFVAPMWPGGLYSSPSTAGSRWGGSVASCWSAMVTFGESGYVETTRKIIEANRKIVKGVRSVPELIVIGEPLLTVIAFTSRPGSNINIFGVSELLGRKGWSLGNLQHPAAIHLSTTLLHVPVADQLVLDIKEAVEVLRKDPHAGDGAKTMIYGSRAEVGDDKLGSKMDGAHKFLDSLTRL